MKITITQKAVFIDGLKWSKRDLRDIGDIVLNILFYRNREGKNPYQIFVDGADETEIFKQQVKAKYQSIPNTELRDSFFKYANISISD